MIHLDTNYQDLYSSNSTGQENLKICPPAGEFLGRVVNTIEEILSRIVSTIKQIWNALFGAKNSALPNIQELSPLRSGMENYQASSCYFASSFQALAACTPLQGLKENRSHTLYTTIVNSLSKDKTIPSSQVRDWIIEAKSIGLLEKELGEHGDPNELITRILSSYEQENFLYSSHKNKLKPLAIPLRAVSVSRVADRTSLQEILDGKTNALSSTQVLNEEKAPSTIVFSLQNRTTQTGINENRIGIPHVLKIAAQSGAPVEYAMRSAIMFQGSSSSGAGNHYYTYELEKSSDNAPVWIEYNDAGVIRHQHQADKIQEMVEKRGYIVFYSKTSK